MSITKEKVATVFNIPTKHVTQVKSKQLFLASIQGELYVVSYLTIVGKFDRVSNKWLITSHKYSSSTYKQLTGFKRENPNHEVVEGEITC